MVGTTATGKSALLVIALLAASFIDRSTATAIGISLPWIEGSLAVPGRDGIVCIVAGNAAYYFGILASPWLVARMGRRRFFIVALTVYGASSLVAAAAQHPWVFIAGRGLQAVAEGGFFVAGLSILLADLPPTVTKPAVLVYGALTLCASALAPFIAGAFADGSSWRVMLVVYGVAAIGTSVAAAGVIPHRTATPSRSVTDVDAPGIALLAVACTAFAYECGYGELDDWFGSSSVTLALVVFGMSSVLLVAWEAAGAAHPLIDVRILRRRNVAIGVIAGVAIGFPLFGITELFHFLSGILEFPASTAGALIALRATTVVLFAPLGTFAIARGVPSRLVVCAGFLITACAFAFEASRVTSASSFESLIVPELLTGLGFSFVYSPLVSTVLTSAPLASAPTAASFMNVAFVLAGSFADAALSIVYDHRSALHVSNLRDAAGLGTHGAAMNLTHAGAMLTALVAQEAGTLAFADVALVSALVAIGGGAISLLLRDADLSVLERRP